MLFLSASHRLVRSVLPRSSQIGLTCSRGGGGEYCRRNLNVVGRPSDLVGNTPLLNLEKILDQHGIGSGHCRLLGKLESLGPCSSVKDRLGLSMINDAEERGLITPGKSVLVEVSL